ncbi:hypothetical protein C7412_10378 [Paraburkholderia silvatlantica]|nr:hypothetical protein C7412_10378 [Paraburkholderia silvatlantica]
MPVTSPWPAEADPFLSLESLDDPAVMAWVEAQNARRPTCRASGP